MTATGGLTGRVASGSVSARQPAARVASRRRLARVGRRDPDRFAPRGVRPAPPTPDRRQHRREVSPHARAQPPSATASTNNRARAARQRFRLTTGIRRGADERARKTPADEYVRLELPDPRPITRIPRLRAENRQRGHVAPSGALGRHVRRRVGRRRRAPRLDAPTGDTAAKLSGQIEGANPNRQHLFLPIHKENFSRDEP